MSRNSYGMLCMIVCVYMSTSTHIFVVIHDAYRYTCYIKTQKCLKSIHIHYIYLCLLSNNQKSSKQWYVAKSGRGLSLSYVFGNGPTQVVSYLGNQHEVVGSNPFLHITSKCFSC